MLLYVLYSRFTDDPSIVYGIFTKEEDAYAAFKKCNDPYKEIAKIPGDAYIEEGIILE